MCCLFDAASVSVPYEITLLSNACYLLHIHALVSVPYKITLLSNCAVGIPILGAVSVPYEITLLSNPAGRGKPVVLFQYLMKLHYSQTLVMNTR